MSSTGRKLDAIWSEFERISANRAKCRHCSHELAPLVDRMKKHFNKFHTNTCHEHEQATSVASLEPSASKQPKMSQFVVSTNPVQKEQFDKDVGRFFFANNISFRAVESPYFKKLVKSLHPGYEPPNRQKLGDQILNNVFSEQQEIARKRLSGKMVTMNVDGWTNCNNESLVCCSVQFADQVYLLETFEMGAERHTAENLTQLSLKAIKYAEESYECTVVALTTDNAENMTKMRRLVAKKIDSLIHVGCVAHQFNLLAKDLTPKQIINKITVIAKLFKNSHVPHGLLAKKEGSTKPVIPSEVRWNTSVKLLKWYIRNWNLLRQVTNENPDVFANGNSNTVKKYISDLALYHQVEEGTKVLEPIAIAVDKVQGDNVTLADALQIWKELLNNYRELGAEGREWLSSAEYRYDMSVDGVFFAAHALHPKYLGKDLNKFEWNAAVEWVKSERCSTLPHFMEFIGGGKEVIRQMHGLSPHCPLINFFKSQELLGNLQKELSELAKTLISIVPTSSGLERIFSSMGFVHSEVRNRLAPEKVSKLAFCLRALNDKSFKE